MEGSGWAVIGVLNHNIHVNKYAPLEARSYIKLPDEIQNKKATVNVQNTDDKCLIYCLGRALDPTPEKQLFTFNFASLQKNNQFPSYIF